MQPELEAYRRRVVRSLGATIVQGMAQSDSSFELISERTGYSVSFLRRLLMRMIGGDGDMRLTVLSDLVWAMGLSITVSVAERILRLPIDEAAAQGMEARKGGDGVAGSINDSPTPIGDAPKGVPHA